MTSFDLVDAQYDMLCESIEGPSRLTFELSHSAQYYAQLVHREHSKLDKEKLKKNFTKTLKQLADGSWSDYLCKSLLNEFVELEQEIDDLMPSQKLVRRRQLIIDLVTGKNKSGSDSGIDSGTSSEDEKMDVEIQQSRTDLDDSDDIDDSEDISDSGEREECDDSDDSDECDE
ncbi:unnamed protein product [Caenorhabditis bovis]|uniref:Uncharacterized protein n=1 Tax=Caenorhabditis bovis TaxID=2654633 RepID=A0A8S1EL64_9PELO|nr:unnamed protein product [Caenorhabditis bovis]